MGNFEGRERIHFTGLLTYAQYRQLLWRTDAHCSFSRPYLLSWSLFEALACAAPLVVSESTAYRSAVPADKPIWVNLDEPNSISSGVRKRLNNMATPENCWLNPAFSMEESVKGWNEVIKEISG